MHADPSEVPLPAVEKNIRPVMEVALVPVISIYFRVGRLVPFVM